MYWQNPGAVWSSDQFFPWSLTSSPQTWPIITCFFRRSSLDCSSSWRIRRIEIRSFVNDPSLLRNCLTASRILLWWWRSRDQFWTVAQGTEWLTKFRRCRIHGQLYHLPFSLKISVDRIVIQVPFFSDISWCLGIWTRCVTKGAIVRPFICYCCSPIDFHHCFDALYRLPSNIICYVLCLPLCLVTLQLFIPSCFSPSLMKKFYFQLYLLYWHPSIHLFYSPPPHLSRRIIPSRNYCWFSEGAGNQELGMEAFRMRWSETNHHCFRNIYIFFGSIYMLPCSG